jgi:putative ABC transport system permease protein
MKWLRRLFHKSQADRQLDSELRFHLDEQVSEYIAAGTPPDEARRHARLEFGGLDQVKEEWHDVGHARLVETFLQDLRYGLRMLRKSPGFTIVAVLTLALGIGVNTAIFSIVDVVLLQPLPYPDSDQLVVLSSSNISQGVKGLGVSFPKLERVAERSHTIEAVGAYFPINSSLTPRGAPEQIPAALTTGAFFKALRVTPSTGRDFLPEEDREGGANVAIISDGFWHSHFGGDPGMIGKAIPVDGAPVTIVGILPPTFKFPFQQPEPDVWFPRAFDVPTLGPTRVHSGAGYLTVYARMKQGVNATREQAEMNALNRGYAKDFPGFVDSANYLLDVTPLKESLAGPLRASLLVLLAAVGLVLLIGCTNVASLLLARATAREREIAVRRALGASRSRLVRQLLTESFVLSCLGGAIGIALAAASLRFLRLLPAGVLPRVEEIQVNASVLCFSLFLCILTTIAFGLVPSLQESRADLHAILKEGGRGSREGRKGGRLRSVLVVAEVTVAAVLATGAGLLIKSFANLVNVNPGFDSRGVMTFAMGLPPTRYPQVAQQSELYRRLVESVEALPAVQSAAVVSHLPLTGAIRFVYFCPEEVVCQGIGKDPLVSIQQITPDYFKTMRIPLLRGRVFDERDIAGANPVVIINQFTAEHYFPNQNPIGRHLLQSRERVQLEIVGVIGNVKFAGLNTPVLDEMYLPQAQSPFAVMTLVVRSDSNPQPLVAAIRQKVLELDRDLPLSNVSSLTEVVSTSVAQPRLTAEFVGVFAVLALSLTSVGIYGVLAHFVTQRTHEIGIRMALGARHADVLKLVLAQGMRLVLIGLAVGFIASLGVMRLLTTLLVGTTASDPFTFACVSVLLFLVALVACYVPAWRAMRVDPLVALRCE